MRLEVDAEQDGYVVVADAFDPGWSATVDDAAAPVLRANVAFRAVPVPAGRHVVEMVYRPRAVARGLALTLLTLALLAVAAATASTTVAASARALSARPASRRGGRKRSSSELRPAARGSPTPGRRGPGRGSAVHRRFPSPGPALAHQQSGRAIRLDDRLQTPGRAAGLDHPPADRAVARARGRQPTRSGGAPGRVDRTRSGRTRPAGQRLLEHEIGVVERGGAQHPPDPCLQARDDPVEVPARRLLRRQHALLRNQHGELGGQGGGHAEPQVREGVSVSCRPAKVHSSWSAPRARRAAR